jgi:hypothetical protein
VIVLYKKGIFFFFGQVLVAHVCNPSYSGGTDQEDHSAKPAWANSRIYPNTLKKNYKKGLVE